MTYELEPIGTIRCNRPDLDHTPVQTRLNWEEPGEIHLDPRYFAALEGLEGFSHLWILSWLFQPGQTTGPDTDLRQLRHHSGWTHTPLPDGDHKWISLFGHTYTTSGRSP